MSGFMSRRNLFNLIFKGTPQILVFTAKQLWKDGLPVAEDL